MASIDQRLTSVEVEVKNLKGMIGSVMSNQSKDHDLLTTVSSQIKTFCAGLEDVQKDAKDANKTNWNRVWAVIAIIISAAVAATCTILLNSQSARPEAKSPTVQEEKEKTDVSQDPVDRG